MDASVFGRDAGSVGDQILEGIVHDGCAPQKMIRLFTVGLGEQSPESGGNLVLIDLKDFVLSFDFEHDVFDCFHGDPFVVVLWRIAVFMQNRESKDPSNLEPSGFRRLTTFGFQPGHFPRTENAGLLSRGSPKHFVMNNSSTRVVGRIVAKRLEQNQPNHVGMTPPRRTPTHEVQLAPISSQPVQAVQLKPFDHSLTISLALELERIAKRTRATDVLAAITNLLLVQHPNHWLEHNHFHTRDRGWVAGSGLLIVVCVHGLASC
jgi:hypothetical protein